jgi:hypothetical protein
MARARGPRGNYIGDVSETHMVSSGPSINAPPFKRRYATTAAVFGTFADSLESARRLQASGCRVLINAIDPGVSGPFQERAALTVLPSYLLTAFRHSSGNGIVVDGVHQDHDGPSVLMILSSLAQLVFEELRPSSWQSRRSWRPRAGKPLHGGSGCRRQRAALARIWPVALFAGWSCRYPASLRSGQRKRPDCRAFLVMPCSC